MARIITFYVGGLTVEKLKRETGVDDSQLATMIREEDINKIAGLFDEVETYLDKLRLLPAQQTDVKDIAYRHSTTLAMIKALKLWCQPDPYQGRRKQFNSGQAISQIGGSGGPPPENFGKILLAGAFWYYLKGI